MNRSQSIVEQKRVFMNTQRFFQNKVVKNAGWIIGGRVIQATINLIVAILTARYLRPDNYGLLNYAAAYTAFFSSLCTLGINSVIVKEFIDRPGSEGQIIGTALGLRAASSMLSAVAIVAIVSVLDASEKLTIEVVALHTLGVVFSIFETYKYWFQSRLESRIPAMAVLTSHILTAAYRVYLIVSGKSIVCFAIASSVDYICVSILLTMAYKRHGGGSLSFSFPYARQLLSKSAHYILPTLMISIYGQTDKLMLKQMLSEANVAFYSTAVTICTGWCFVLNAIIESMQPGIIESFRDGEKAAYLRKNRLLYAIVFWIPFVVSILLTAAAKPVVSLLYGDDYLPAAAPLSVITWYISFSYLGGARNAWIVCENKQKYLIWIYLSAAFANIILNLWLIPIWGTVGAALASLAAQIITTMVTPFFIPDLRPNAMLMVEAIFLKGLNVENDCDG